MSTLHLKLNLFISSYSPVFYIALIRLFEDLQLSWTIFSILFAVLTLVVIYTFWRSYQGLFAHDKQTNNPCIDRTIYSPRPIKDRLFTSYVVSYLLPILNVNFTSAADTVTFLLIMVLLFVLSLQINMYYFNPLLLIMFGYQAYEVTVDDGGKPAESGPKDVMILSRNQLEFFYETPRTDLVKIKDGIYYHRSTIEN